MAEAKVMYDYEAVQDDELNLKEGQTITNIAIMEDGWWQGEVNGQRGLFPDNFVELLTKDKPVPVKGKAPSTPPTPTPTPTPTPVPTSAPAATPAVAPAAAAPTTTVNGESQDVTRREGSEKSKKLRAKVVYSYHPQNEDEIDLTVGDVIVVTGQPEDGWWEGVLGDNSGLFPSNFVTVIEGEEGAGSADKADGGSVREAPPVPREVPRKGPEKVRGVGFGDIFASGEVKLRKTGGGASGNPSKKPLPTAPSELAQKRLSLKRPDALPTPKPAGHAEAKPRQDPKPDVRREEKKDAKVTEEEEFEEIVRERARATFPYEAQHSDELELKDGDVVTVLDKEAGDSGWWLGEVDGRKGVFPDNFVTMLPPEKEKVKKRTPVALPARPVSTPKPLPPETKPPASKPTTKPALPQDGPVAVNALPRRPSANQDAVAQQKMEPPARKTHPTAAPKPPKKVLPIPNRKPKAKVPPPKPSGPPPDREEAQPQVVLRRPVVEENKEPAAEGGLEDIKPESGQKLTHLNLSRPKNTNRRPPSVFGSVNLGDSRNKAKLHKENSDAPDGRIPPSSPPSSTVVTSPTSPSNSSQPSWVRELKARSLKRSSPLSKEAQSPVENGTVAPPPRPKVSPIGPTSPATASPPQAATAIKKPTTEASPAHSPATSRPMSLISDTSGQQAPSNAQVDELKKDIKSLQDQMASLRSEFKKEVVNLMSEVDEEKKHRMAMQVELDRIKKLVLEKK